MSAVRIVADGVPAPQGSKKHVGRGRMVEASKTLPAWRAVVGGAARAAAGPGWVPWDGPVMVSGTVSIARPGSTKFRDFPAGPADLDKLLRAIGDALTKSKIITDDARIVNWNVWKVWADGAPGADLVVAQVSAADAARIPGTQRHLWDNKNGPEECLQHSPEPDPLIWY